MGKKKSTTSKEKSSAQRTRTEANKKRRKEKREFSSLNAKQSSTSRKLVCACGKEVWVNNYKMKPDQEYKCAKCRGLCKCEKSTT